MRENSNTNRAASDAIELDDRRSFERHQFGQIVQVVWLDGQQVQRRVQHCRAVDLSRGGLRLLGKYMHYQDALGVVLLRRAGGECVLHGVRVRNSVYVGGLMYATGCEFVAAHERLIRAIRVVNDHLEFSDRIEDFI
jgi:hypothetical protein